jgi:hypothetical protein
MPSHILLPHLPSFCLFWRACLPLRLVGQAATKRWEYFAGVARNCGRFGRWDRRRRKSYGMAAWRKNNGQVENGEKAASARKKKKKTRQQRQLAAG